MRNIIIAVVIALAAIAGISSAITVAPAGATSGDDCVPTEDGWQRYSWTGGPHAGDDPPPFPSEDWQANVAGDPQGIGVEGAYFVSHGGSGLGDWFYLELVPGHDCPPPDTTTTEPPTCEDDPTLEGCGESTTTEPELEAVCNPVTGEIIEVPVEIAGNFPAPDDPACDDTPRPRDVCRNLGGVQTTVPVGFIFAGGGRCVPIPDAPPTRTKRHAPPGTVVGDCVVQENEALLCGEQG